MVCRNISHERKAAGGPIGEGIVTVRDNKRRVTANSDPHRPISVPRVCGPAKIAINQVLSSHHPPPPLLLLLENLLRLSSCVFQ